MPSYKDDTTQKRITLIPGICGKITHDGKLTEPDILYILQKWLDRHRQFKGREQEIRITSGRWTLPEGIRTEIVRATIAYSDEIAGYDPAEDADLYEFYLAEEREG
jgi:hypothetical protein